MPGRWRIPLVLAAIVFAISIDCGVFLHRRQGEGLDVDVLEPHSLCHDDSAAKAQGLADFALRHGDLFGAH